MATTYKRGKRYWCTGYDRNGKRWWEPTRQTDERIAKKVAAQIESEIALGTYRSKNQAAYSVEKALDDMATHMARLVRVGKRAVETLEGDRKSARHVRRLLGKDRGNDRQCADLEIATTDGYLAKRLDEGAHPNTVHKEIRVLLKSLRRAKRLKRYTSTVDPRDLYPEDLVSPYVPRERWLSVSEFQMLVAELAPKGKKFQRGERSEYVIVFCSTGLRLGEFKRLEPKHCDFVRSLIHVPGTKTGKAKRVMPMTPVVAEILSRRAKAKPTCKLFAPWPGMRRDLDAACMRIEARLNPGIDLPKHTSKKKVPRKGRMRPPVPFDSVSPNDLRRTFASWLAQEGVPLLHAAKLMGHTSTRMLEHVYARLAPQNLIDAVGKLPIAIARSESAVVDLARVRAVAG